MAETAEHLDRSTGLHLLLRAGAPVTNPLHTRYIYVTYTSHTRHIHVYISYRSICYCAQVTVRPPTIAIFCNDPSLFGNTYRRYLEQVAHHARYIRHMCYMRSMRSMRHVRHMRHTRDAPRPQPFRKSLGIPPTYITRVPYATYLTYVAYGTARSISASRSASRARRSASSSEGARAATRLEWPRGLTK